METQGPVSTYFRPVPGSSISRMPPVTDQVRGHKTSRVLPGWKRIPQSVREAGQILGLEGWNSKRQACQSPGVDHLNPQSFSFFTCQGRRPSGFDIILSPQRLGF